MSVEMRVPHYGVLFDRWLVGQPLGNGLFRLESEDGQEECLLKVVCILQRQGSLVDLDPQQWEEYTELRRSCRREEEDRLTAGTPDCLEYTFLDWEDGTGYGRDLLIRMEKMGLEMLPEDPEEAPREDEAPQGGSNVLLKVLIGALVVAILCTGFIFGKIVLTLREQVAQMEKPQPVPVATLAEIPTEEATEVPTEAPTEPAVVLDPTRIVDLAIGKCHAAAVYEDGSVDVVYLGESMRRKYPAWEVWDAAEATTWTDIVQVSISRYHMAGLKRDGTVVAIGGNEYGECETAQWTDIIAIGTLDNTTIGLKADGTLVSAGSTNKTGSVAYIEDAVAIDLGSGCLEFLQSDGSWRRRLPDGSEQVLGVYPELTKIYSNENDSIGVLSDGTLVVGRTSRLNKGKLAEWTDIVQVWGDASCLLGLKTDGTVCAMGTDNQNGQQNVRHWTGVAKLAGPSLAIKEDGTLAMSGTSLLQSFDLGPLNKAPSAVDGKTGKVANSSTGVNVRAYPGINCDVVTRLPMGTEVIILEEKATYDGMNWGRTWYGWISMDFVALEE